MRRHRTILASCIVALALTSAALAGCTSVSATVSSNNQIITLVQHQAQMNVAPGQTSSATASCGSGETLVGGGYYSNQQLGYGKLAVLDSYPSDGSGVAPTTQGQVETAWTVRAQNPSSASVMYTIMANCVKGIPIKTGVWFTSYAQTDINGNDSDVALNCTNSLYSVLTGGGFQSALNGGKISATDGVVTAYPSEENGVADQTWRLRVWDVNGTSYVVCAHGVVAAPEASADGGDDFKTAKYVSASCGGNEVLTGGGYFQGGLKGGGDPVTVDTSGIPDLSSWDAGYNAPGGGGEFSVVGICIQAQSKFNIAITFSNYHHLLRIPADDVIVATDGSGQVKASQVTVRVTQQQSAPIAATKTTNPFTGGVSYVVPAGCGDPAPANAAAADALKQALNGKVPAGQVAFGDPTITINRGSLTCSPAAGTSRTTPFTYTQAIDGSAAQSSYIPQEVTNYQLAQLRHDAASFGSQYALRDTLICPDGPQLVSATATKATVACTAYGVVEWQWTAEALQALAQSLAGKSKDAALEILNVTPGIDPNSAMIDLLQRNMLPSDASQITIIVVRPQDTAPVLRAP